MNILNLAKNAGTSVEQFERFYDKHLTQDGEEPPEFWHLLTKVKAKRLPGK